MSTATATQTPGPPITTVTLALNTVEASQLLKIMNFINNSPTAGAAAKNLAADISTALSGAGVT